MTTTISTDLIELGRLFAEIASGHDVSRFEEIVAPDYVNHNPFAEPGLEGVKKVFGGSLIFDLNGPARTARAKPKSPIIPPA
jgi:hypothetical protein